MSTLNFLGVAHSEIGSAILKKGEITLYTQKTESRNTNFKSIKYGLISEDKRSDTFFKVIWYAKSENECLQAEKWRLIELICMFSRWPPNHTESYIVVDSLFNVPRNICGGPVLVFVLLCIYLCSFYFC